MTALDPFALGGHVVDDALADDDEWTALPTITVLPINALWEWHGKAIAEITKLDDDEEIETVAQCRDEIEVEICRRMTTSIPELIIQATLLRSFIGLGSMADDIDLKLCANIILGLQQLNAF